MGRSQIKKSIKVIKLKEMELTGKDVLVLESFDDFIWMTGSLEHIYEFKGDYYSLGDDIVFCYHKNKEDKK